MGRPSTGGARFGGRREGPAKTMGPWRAMSPLSHAKPQGLELRKGASTVAVSTATSLTEASAAITGITGSGLTVSTAAGKGTASSAVGVFSPFSGGLPVTVCTHEAHSRLKRNLGLVYKSTSTTLKESTTNPISFTGGTSLHAKGLPSADQLSPTLRALVG